MPWEPGQSGNPDGAKKHKVFYAALNRAILQEDGLRVRKAAEKLLDLASEGEAWAIKELRDTLDGKPGLAIDLGSDPERPMITKLVREIVRANDQDR
jgi:hypothetical protein